MWGISMDIISEFKSKDAFDFIQHFPVWVASLMSVWVGPCDLVSGRCMQLSVRMSAAISMSMNKPSSFEESCPSNEEISWNMVVVRFDSLCVACKVSVYTYMVLHTDSSLGWGFKCSLSIIGRYCSLSVSCINSTVDVDWWVVDIKLEKWSLSCKTILITQPRMTSVSFFTVFINWFIVSIEHSVF